MKKLIFSILILVSVSLPTFAYIAGKNALKPEQVYCPKEITCKTDTSTCVLSEESFYWDKLQSDGGGTTTTEGVYKLIQAEANYAPNSYPHQTSCSYKNGSYGWIKLLAKKDANLEAYHDQTTKWRNAGDYESCDTYPKTIDPSICPFKVRSGLGVLNKINNNKVYIHAKYANNQITYDASSNIISYEDAAICWGLKQCKIDFEAEEGEWPNTVTTTIGSVIVDMDNYMKVLAITPNSLSNIGIKKVNYFNTIELSALDMPTSVSLQAANFISSSVAISIKNTTIAGISPRGGIINLTVNRVKEHCPNTKECTLDVKTTQGGIIGFVSLDAETMDVLSVQSVRATEIYINKVNEHKVEIKYATVH